MDATRAVAAVTSTLSSLDSPVHDVTIIQNSTRLSLRLLPCHVFARVAPVGMEVSAAFEVELAQQLIAGGAPVVALDTKVAPRVYLCHGFAVTFWTYHDTAGKLMPADYADALEQRRRRATPSRRASSREHPDFT